MNFEFFKLTKPEAAAQWYNTRLTNLSSQHNDIQHNDNQHNDIQHNHTRCNVIKHNGT